ncbi:MAG: hypothetical protein IJ461_02345, partial [Clostridia bacterium]|nr:hypothetical protein [Clostridia bacterium]
ALLNGGGKRVNIRTEEGKNAEVSAFRGADAQIEPEGRLTVSLHVTAYTPVVDSPSQQALEEALKKELEELIAKLQAAQSDAAGFNRQALWGTATLAEAEQKVWRFEQAQVTVQVDAQMVISSS